MTKQQLQDESTALGGGCNFGQANRILVMVIIGLMGSVFVYIWQGFSGVADRQREADADRRAISEVTAKIDTKLEMMGTTLEDIKKEVFRTRNPSTATRSTSSAGSS